jgi:hypothetical protein
MHDFLSWVEATEFSTWIRESGSLWSYPIILTLHTIGLGILVGFNWALDLRLLGVAREVPLGNLKRFFPWMWWGFWINLFSGLLLLAADATTKMTSWVFGLKMAFVILGVLVLRRIQSEVFFKEDRRVDGRSLAWISLACWVLAITAGRLTAYLGPQVGLAGPQIK